MGAARSVEGDALPGSVDMIEAKAFFGCTALKSVTFPTQTPFRESLTTGDGQSGSALRLGIWRFRGRFGLVSALSTAALR